MIAHRVQANVNIKIAGTIDLNPSMIEFTHSLNDKAFVVA